MNKYEFYVLSSDTVVAKWERKTLTVFNENLLPLYLKHNPNAEHWIASRVIDSRRANARLLKKALRFREKDDLKADSEKDVFSLMRCPMRRRTV